MVVLRITLKLWVYVEGKPTQKMSFKRTLSGLESEMP
jgi:hypothetical protein